ncbi:MAG TPA: hypothetical protein VF257_16985 [Solirubrobacteraceae bacterium]
MPSYEPQPPVLFDAFRERRTRRQRVRATVRALDLARQRALVGAARLARPLTSRLRG